jgi:hypothetical protein
MAHDPDRRHESSEDGSGVDLSRRAFMGATGTAVGASILGLGATGSAAAAEEFDPAFANWRVREASKVWERGYRGRPDRTIGLTDSGISARHPDVGPWNGIKATTEDGKFALQSVSEEVQEVPITEAQDIETRTFTGETGGVGVLGLITTTEYFTVAGNTDRLEATLSWNSDTTGPQLNDADFTLEDADGNPVASSGSGGLDVQESNTETISTEAVEGGAEYRFAVTGWRGVVAWSIEATTQELVETNETETKEVTTTSPFDGDVFADASNKTFGWYDAGPRYGTFDRPRDTDGHGSHCSSIMGGTGRASTVDEDSLVQEEPRAVLAAGEFLDYEVDVDAEGGVFAGAYGDGIELLIEGPDGQTIEQVGLNADHSLFDNNLTDHPAVHESGTATYTVYVRPWEGTALSTGRVDRVAVGALADPDTTDGSRNGDISLHAGMAPDAGLVGLQGLSAPTADLGTYAEDFASAFNMRAVNMSWGYVGGLPLGAAGGTIEEAAFGQNLPARLKEIAQGGMLPCAAAGNSVTPANGNGDPAVADEAISVVATDPVDGLTSYSSGGLGGLDEDGEGVYTKPEISAPGGAADGFPGGVYDLVRAAKTGEANTPAEEQDPIRDYTLKAGTSMATPYINGVAGLLAQAMEEDAPAEIALPEPAAAGIEDVYRMKQTLLATASETVFTAAPFHHPEHRPTYDFGGRDPYEGFGRVNPDAAVDAVSRELSGTTSETVGLNVPEDSRAVAGYARAGPGTLSVDVAFSHYSGGNKGATQGAPHVDLFVYDAANPEQNGEPNIVASGQGLEGSPSASASFGRDATESVYYVVAKLVNVPGVVNTDDVQAHMDLSVNVDPGIFVSGTRTDDGSVFTAGQTDQMDLTVNPSEAGPVRDAVPTEWTVKTEFSEDVERVEEREGVKYVYFGETAAADTQTEYTYLVEAPGDGSLVGGTGTYSFGPVAALIDGEWIAAAGTSETNYVVGTSTNV